MEDDVDFSPTSLQAILNLNKTSNDNLIKLFRKICYYNNDEDVMRRFQVRFFTLFAIVW
jgi:hypothetical protein